MTNKYVQILAGVDEVGRGPLAGDVIAAAVILNLKNKITGLTDSKKLSEKNRQKFAAEIKDKSLCWSIARSNVEEIDTYNILEATMSAMKRAVEGLNIKPEFVIVDGNSLPKWHYPSKSIVKGDASEPSIAAASIIAKVFRDQEMCSLDKIYPGYGFSQHKGYGTKKHLEAINRLGPTPVHRKSFEPIKSILSGRL
ncbi:MAG: ribonuclease HII [Porticoccus sp.]|jgi:ribonuclease HII|nr:ribonuclease HII [Porticoccus sp.]|tara:strand:- start:930 stop:1517 length:588 start_codon:yes stop_codon:yes gene_type:complete